MEFDFQWLEEQDFAVKDGIDYTGGKEKYIAALQRFYGYYESNKETLEAFHAADDLSGFGIRVHALKGNARMIGANKLADRFEQLESLANAGDKAALKDQFPDVLTLYHKTIDLLQPIGSLEKIQIAGELSAEEAGETAAALLDALEDFDDDLAAELARKLTGYPFRLKQKELLAKARTYINDFMYEEAEDLVREIIPSIE